MVPIVYVTKEERRSLWTTALALKQKFGGLTLELIHWFEHNNFGKNFLPPRLFDTLYAFRTAVTKGHGFGVVLIRGVFDEFRLDKLPPTPAHYELADGKNYFPEAEIISFLFHIASGGSVMKWRVQRSGKNFAHYLVPIASQKNYQTGGGSTKLLMHTEDSMLNACADLITFLYVRNFEAAPSSFISFNQLNLPGCLEEELRRSQFRVPLDDNFKDSPDFERCPATTRAILSTEQMWKGSEPINGVAIDFAEMPQPYANQTLEAAQALDEFTKIANAHEVDCYPEPGDLAYGFNSCFAHSRGAYEAGWFHPNNLPELSVDVPARMMVRVMSVFDTKMSFIQKNGLLDPHDNRLINELHLGSTFKI